MTVTIKRRLLVALVVWAVLLAGASVLFTGTSGAHTSCASPTVWLGGPPISWLPPCVDDANTNDGDICAAPGGTLAGYGARVYTCVHP